MLSTFISMFSVFGLAAALGGCLYLAQQILQSEARVKVPVKTETSYQRRDKRV